MKILFISTYNRLGGAAIAASRLLHAVRDTGCDASMAVFDKQGNDPAVFTAGNKLANRFRFYWERGIIFLYNRLSRKNLFEVSIANTGTPITKLKAFKEADVIHLHWVNQGMLSIKEIGRILSSGKKVVWTMHDMWPFSGIAHYDGGAKCLLPKMLTHLSDNVFQKKYVAYAKGPITFVACSNWLRELANQSKLTEGHTVISIPNPIDTEVYRPYNRNEVRERMQLPKEKKIILFAAMKATDPRKGMEYLTEASRLIAQKKDNLLCLIAGANSNEIAEQFPLPAQGIGFVSQKEMIDLYNAADLFVTPSLQDNLPNTIMEAMACGTPCVGFNTGGIPEMIDHRHNGYVAEYKDAADLAEGLRWCLFEADQPSLSENARNKVMDKYTPAKVAQQYIKIYERKK